MKHLFRWVIGALALITPLAAMARPVLLISIDGLRPADVFEARERGMALPNLSAFLTTGTDYTNCGRPCDRHSVRLRDRVGAEHSVRADAGCRNTVFNALAQTGAEHVAKLQALGARRFRVEFLDEPPSQVALTIEKYRQLLAGSISGAQLWRELKLLNQLGVTRGPMG